MATRHFSSRKEILHHLSTHQKSGLTRSAYCKKNTIAESTFYYWCKRYGKELEKKQTQASFVPITVSSSTFPQATQYFEILVHGCTVRVPSRFDDSDLRRIVTLLMDIR